jgi:hypothetical protein
MRKLLIVLTVLANSAALAQDRQSIEEAEAELRLEAFLANATMISEVEQCGFAKLGGLLINARLQRLTYEFTYRLGLPKGWRNITAMIEDAVARGHKLGMSAEECASIDPQTIYTIRSDISRVSGIPLQALHR